MKKKILAAALAVFATFTFASCAGPVGPAGAPGASGAKGEQGIPGEDGKDGAGVEKVEFDEEGKLVITLTDGTVLDGVELPKQEPEENFQYRKNKDGKGYCVVGIGNVSECELVIPATYKGLPVTEIGERAFNNDTYVTKVTFPKTVVKIGRYAFGGCKSLTEIVFRGAQTQWEAIEKGLNWDNLSPSYKLICEIETDTFEAEYTEIADGTYMGLSGGLSGNGIVCTSAEGDVQYLSYLYKKGTTVTFKINASEAVDNVTLQARLASEGKTGITVAPTGEYAWKVKVNGKELDYTPFTMDGELDSDLCAPFETYTLSTTVSLVKGENVIELVTDNDTAFFGTAAAFAPVVDYIKLTGTGTVTLSYMPVDNSTN